MREERLLLFSWVNVLRVPSRRASPQSKIENRKLKIGLGFFTAALVASRECPRAPADIRRGTFINTQRERGRTAARDLFNRFSGLPRAGETAQAVHRCSARPFTPLKRGVNERFGSPIAFGRFHLSTGSGTRVWVSCVPEGHSTIAQRFKAGF
jgi:hypothetical protein